MEHEPDSPLLVAEQGEAHLQPVRVELVIEPLSPFRERYTLRLALVEQSTVERLG